MIKSLLRLGLILVVGILIYNYFLGTDSEKATSKKIFSEVRDLGEATWDLLKSEKEKFDQGKYDEALDKIGNLLGSLKSKAEKLEDSGLLDELQGLDRKRKDLQDQLSETEVKEYDNTEAAKAEKEAIKKAIRELSQKTEEVMNKMEKGQE